LLADRNLSPYLLYSGIAFALILRFEFMGKGFTKFIGILTSLAMGLTVLAFLDQVFGDGRGLF
jgi:xanthine/uracil permease